MKVIEFVVIPAVAVILASCSVLPKAGPNAADVVGMSGDGADQRYEFFDIDKPLIEVLRHQRRGSLFSQFGDYRRSSESTIGVGDTVSVTIWEAPGGVLFAPSAMTVASNSSSRGGGVIIARPCQIRLLVGMVRSMFPSPTASRLKV